MELPKEVADLAPGAIGSGVAIAFARKDLRVSVAMFVGGSAMAHFGTKWVGSTLGMTESPGLVGFLIGIFGMAAVLKVYDAIENIKLSDLWDIAKDVLRKKGGVEKKEGQ